MPKHSYTLAFKQKAVQKAVSGEVHFILYTCDLLVEYIFFFLEQRLIEGGILLHNVHFWYSVYLRAAFNRRNTVLACVVFPLNLDG